MQATEEQAGSRTAIGSPSWKALESHSKKVRKLHLRKLFADDPTRGERLTASAAGIEEAPGSVMPIASAIAVIVEAVPMVMQVP